MNLLKEKIEKIIRNIINERKEFAYGGRGDEFYTQESDVQDILTTLCDELRGKVVYCPCANPEMSHFYKFLKENFSKFGLRGLYTTWMANKVCYFDGQECSVFFGVREEGGSCHVMRTWIGYGRFRLQQSSFSIPPAFMSTGIPS